MSEELLAVRMWRVTWKFFQSVIFFIGAVLAMAAGAGALGVVVAFVAILISEISEPVQGRILAQPAFKSNRTVTDDLTRICEMGSVESSHGVGGEVTGVDRRDHRSDRAVLAELGLPKEIRDHWDRHRAFETRNTGIEDSLVDFVYRDVCAPKTPPRRDACEARQSFSYQSDPRLAWRRFALRKDGWWDGSRVSPIASTQTKKPGSIGASRHSRPSLTRRTTRALSKTIVRSPPKTIGNALPLLK